ncbi:MAG: glycosyltransferase family 4 protein [Desulfobacter sp.]
MKGTDLLLYERKRRRPGGLSIGIIGGLSEGKFRSKIKPLVCLENVGKVYLFRYNGNCLKEYEKVKVLRYFELVKVPRRLFDLIYIFYFTYLCMLGKLDMLVGIYFFPHGMFAGILGLIFKVPVVQVTTGTDLKKLTKGAFSALLNSGKHVGVRGEISKAELIKLGINEQKIFILNNFAKKNKTQAMTHSVEKKYDLIYVGYLRPLKRLDILLNVVKRLKENIPCIKCLIVGDGPSKSDLLEMRKKNGIEDNVIFTGHVNNVDSYLETSKIFIMTSESEGLPMAMIEAMSWGLPVVVPNINDIPTIAKHGESGFLINSTMVDDYYNHCRTLLTDHGLRARMGHSSASAIQELYKHSFSFEAVSKVWAGVLGENEPRQ